MAQLRTTSKGQLVKYSAGLVAVVTNSMKDKITLKVGAKSFVVANTKENSKTLDQYVSLAGNPSSEKEAVSLVLKSVTDEFFPIGNLEKPKDTGNKGDIAEGIIGAAITARFINKNRDITKEDVKKVIKSLGSTVSKIKQVVSSSPNKNPKIIDDIKFYLSLADSNMKTLLDSNKWSGFESLFDSSVKYANSKTVIVWSKLLYENNQKNFIEIISDGLGNQSGTKVDVMVKVDGKTTNINLSLKVGDVKQFGQVGGSSFDKQVLLWKQTFNIDVSSLENKYNNLLEQKQTEKAVQLTYTYASNEINKLLSSSKTKKKFLQNLANGINFHATRGEENVTLVQLTTNQAKIYQFDNILEVLSNLNLKSTIKDSAGKPKMIITDDSNKSLIEIRVKAESKPDGSIYIRNYIEKGELLGNLISTYA